ncbi:MAG: AAA family ATPase [Firmicutes bacterium]|nr:AAA family ATPase [Bacillota bacterium]
MAKITIPRTTLLVLSGSPGCGKSTFASRYFRDTEIVSSDECRRLVSDSETNMAASREAFKLFRFTIARRLALGRLTVADSTALTGRARYDLLRIGRKYGFNVTLLVFNIPEEVCLARNAGRDRRVVRPVIARMQKMLRQSLKMVEEEGFDAVHVLGEEDLGDPAFRISIKNHELTLSGPFDIIGDLHGCFDELKLLLEKLGYKKQFNYYTNPAGRKAVFLGDITDRGPRSLDTFWLVKAMVDSGNALYVPGNHCRKLARYLEGRNVKAAHGLEKTIDEIKQLAADERDFFAEEFLQLYREAPPYMILDGGGLVVAHGGIKEEMIGKVNERIRSFCFFGDATGEITEDGLPVRRDWAREYRGEALVVYGHTPVPEAEFVNNTIDIDQGCVMGGKLTAFRYPEREIIQVPALKAYYERSGFTAGAEEHGKDDAVSDTADLQVHV